MFIFMTGVLSFYTGFFSGITVSRVANVRLPGEGNILTFFLICKVPGNKRKITNRLFLEWEICQR